MNENTNLEKELNNIGKETKEIKTLLEHNYKLFDKFQEFASHTEKIMNHMEQQIVENTKKVDSLVEKGNNNEE